MPFTLEDAYEQIKTINAETPLGNYPEQLRQDTSDCYRVARGVHNFVRVTYGLNSQMLAQKGAETLAKDLGLGGQNATYLVRVSSEAHEDLNDEQDDKASGSTISAPWTHLFTVLKKDGRRSLYQGFADGYTLAEWLAGEFANSEWAPERQFTPAASCPMTEEAYLEWVQRLGRVMAEKDQQERAKVAKTIFGRGKFDRLAMTPYALELWWCKRSDGVFVQDGGPPQQTGILACLAAIFCCCCKPTPEYH